MMKILSWIEKKIFTNLWSKIVPNFVGQSNLCNCSCHRISIVQVSHNPCIQGLRVWAKVLLLVAYSTGTTCCMLRKLKLSCVNLFTNKQVPDCNGIWTHNCLLIKLIKLNNVVFIYELSGSRLSSGCSKLNFRYCAYSE